MTSTSLKSPMSGTRTSFMRRPSYRAGVRLGGIDAVFLHRLGNAFRLAFAGFCQRLQGGEHDEIAVHLEEMAQPGARVGAAEAILPKHLEDGILRHEWANVVGTGVHVSVGCR